MEVLRDVKNGLMKRREIKLVIEADKNPGFAESVESIVSKFGANKDLVVVNTIKSKFGRRTFLIDAYVYDSATEKERWKLKEKVKKTAGAAPAGAKK